MPLDAPGLGPLVGRDEELSRLAGALGIPLAGVGSPSAPTQGGVVVLSGDAGIGKTRLLAELADAARSSGWRVLVGHCLGEAGSTVPHLPFMEILGQVTATSPDLVREALTAYPSVARLAPRSVQADVPATTRSELSAGDRGGLLEDVHGVLEQVATAGPVLVVVEDTHWADQSTRELLTLLLTRGFAGPVALVVSLRSDDLHRRHPLRATLAHWSRLTPVRRVDLGPLDAGAMGRLIRGLDAGLGEDQLDTVVERAEGNAFFAEELAAAAQLGHAGTSEDLSRLLLVRFEQLDVDAQQVVRTASVAGRRVSHELLSRVVTIEPAQFDAAVRLAVEHYILVPARADYAFRHALLAETVYDDLLPGERVRIHQAFAHTLRDDARLGRAADTARHALEAGDQELALDASVRAGEEAMALGGPEEALRHFARALALMPGDPGRAARISIAAAGAASAAGHLTKAVGLLRERLDDGPFEPSTEAELLGELAQAARVTELDIDTAPLTARALELVGPDDLTPVRARVLFAHAQALADRGRSPDALKAAREAMALSTRLGLAETATEIETFLARVTGRDGDPDASREVLERVIAESSSVMPRVRAVHHLAALEHHAGHHESALALYRRGHEEAARVGRAWAPYAFDCRALAVLSAYAAGRWDLSLELAELGRDDAAPETARAMLAAGSLHVVAGRGDLARATATGDLRPSWGDDGLLVILDSTARVDLHGYAGDLEAATTVHREGRDFLRELWGVATFEAELRLNTVLVGQLVRAAVAASTGERATLAARGEALDEVSERVWDVAVATDATGLETLAWRARALAEVGRLRWVADPTAVDATELVEQWRTAVRAFEAYAHPYEVARSRVALAAVLAPDAPQEAREVGALAARTARELGAAPLLADLGRLAPATPPLASGVGGLTPRETEILHQLARGRSNKEIGGRLFISAKTASVHVSNIMAKLGVHHRGEAVAVARDRGLLD